MINEETKHILLRVGWRVKEGQELRDSDYTNTVLKKKCPELLFDFYESNLSI